MTSEERSVYIQTLRDKFLNGSLDDILIPGNPPIERLLDAIFDKRTAPKTPRTPTSVSPKDEKPC